MNTKTVLTDKEIIELGIQACAIEPGLNGYVLPIEFARSIERAIMKSLPVETSNTIRGDSYAGVYAWLGSSNITHHISELSIEDMRDPQSMLEHVAFQCIKQLERYDAMQSPEVQEMRKDAERYRWLKNQFEIMSRDMRYNQVWVLKQPIESGQTMDEACDNAMKREE